MAELHGMNCTLLWSHIGMGAWTVARYQINAFTNGQKAPKPSALDLAISFTNAVCSWFLARKRILGNRRISRTAFQALSIMMGPSAATTGWWLLWPQYSLLLPPPPSSGPIESLAMSSQTAWWYRSMVKTHFTFAYVRIIGQLDRISPMFTNHGERFTVTVFTGCVLSAMDAGGMLGGVLLLSLVVLLNRVEQNVSAAITPENEAKPLARLALFVGLVDMSTYSALWEAERKRGAAQPTDKHPGDQAGRPDPFHYGR